jgi:spermidine synthase
MMGALRSRHFRPFVEHSDGTQTLYFSVYDVQSQMRTDRPDDLMLPYTRLMMGFLLFVPSPRHIAMVGLGGGSMAKFCHRHLPEARITVVEINPYVIALRDDFQVPTDDHRFQVRLQDAAVYVRSHAAGHDVLLVDGFTGAGLPANLCSAAFYHRCFQMLAPGGTMVVNLHSHHDEFVLHLLRLRDAFHGQVMTVMDDVFGNVIAFAIKGFAARPLLANLRTCAETLPPDAWRQLKASFSSLRRSGSWSGHGGP